VQKSTLYRVYENHCFTVAQQCKKYNNRIREQKLEAKDVLRIGYNMVYN